MDNSNRAITTAKQILNSTQKSLMEARRLAADIRGFAIGPSAEAPNEKRPTIAYVEALDDVRGDAERLVSDLSEIANTLGVYDDKVQSATGRG